MSQQLQQQIYRRRILGLVNVAALSQLMSRIVDHEFLQEFDLLNFLLDPWRPFELHESITDGCECSSPTRQFCREIR